MRLVTLITAARGLSLGLWIMIALMIGSVAVLFGGQRSDGDAVVMWVFSPTHRDLYQPMLERAGAEVGTPLDMRLMSIQAIERRMMSGFFSGLPTADLIECERAIVGRAFTGPLEAVGFLDITDRLRDEGLLEKINAPSFGPWTSRGRIFGIPHDVHPVMLAYRADLVEAAGIDLSGVETWDDFFRAVRPLMGDPASPERFALGFWYTHLDNVEVLLLQGGDGLFDQNELPTIATERHADLLARMVSWCVGPDRVAADIEDFSGAGHQQRIDGYGIAYFAPDWMCSIWKEQIPQIGGKMKLMPLPAFEPGGRRTSVRGGTMLGIARDSDRIEEAWEYAKLLYTSPRVAREMYQLTDIITPVTSLWDDPIYDEPDPFFMGQPKGRMYIDLAPHVPARSSSPYNRQAVVLIRDAAVSLADHARRTRTYDAEGLRPEAMRLLTQAEARILRVMERNAFSGVAGGGR
ncbi:MAG: extracellular solute-binding protein [Phycisphaerales bacterium]|nr:extracellular solute-binding protein [Planctomycetota bacterium]MCH8507702.1 extracellular solute-binding protein [Phycisphaerales bacterium]